MRDSSYHSYLSRQTVIVVVDVRSQISKVRIETALRRRVALHVEAQMPFANDVRAIATVAHILGQQFLVEPQAPRLLRRNDEVLHAHMRRVFAAHQRRSRRCAHRSDVVAIQADAERAQGVNVGRGYLIGSVEADIVESLQ